MGRAAAEIPVAAVLMARAMELVVLIPASNTIKVIRVVIIKVIRVATINNHVKGVSSSSLDIKVIQSS